MHRFHRRFARPLVLAIALAGLTSLDPGLATASDPFALYAVPTAVEMLPSDATATRVVIHGALLFLSMTRGAGKEAAYTDPKCGKMYFECPAGEEMLCRMQWQDVSDAIGKGYCAGFGTMNMLSTATLSAEDAALTKPDRWEMGMGVAMASYLGGQCPKASTLKCPLSPMGGVGAGGGAGGGGAGGGGAGGGGAGGSGGAGSSGGAGGAGDQHVDAGTGGHGGATGAGGTGESAATGGAIGMGGSAGAGGVDGAAGQGGGKKPGGGCAIIGPSLATANLMSAAFVAAIVIRTTRRRPRRNR